MALIIKKNKYVVFGFVVFSLTYLLSSNFHREDWKSVSANLGDSVYMIQSFGDPVNYYNRDCKVNDIRGTVSGDTIKVIPYGELIHGVVHNNILVKQGYKLEETKNYREMIIETWQKGT